MSLAEMWLLTYYEAIDEATKAVSETTTERASMSTTRKVDIKLDPSYGEV